MPDVNQKRCADAAECWKKFVWEGEGDGGIDMDVVNRTINSNIFKSVCRLMFNLQRAGVNLDEFVMTSVRETIKAKVSRARENSTSRFKDTFLKPGLVLGAISLAARSKRLIKFASSKAQDKLRVEQLLGHLEPLLTSVLGEGSQELQDALRTALGAAGELKENAVHNVSKFLWLVQLKKYKSKQGGVTDDCPCIPKDPKDRVGSPSSYESLLALFQCAALDIPRGQEEVLLSLVCTRTWKLVNMALYLLHLIAPEGKVDDYLAAVVRRAINKKETDITDGIFRATGLGTGVEGAKNLYNAFRSLASTALESVGEALGLNYGDGVLETEADPQPTEAAAAAAAADYVNNSGIANRFLGAIVSSGVITDSTGAFIINMARPLIDRFLNFVPVDRDAFWNEFNINDHLWILEKPEATQTSSGGSALVAVSGTAAARPVTAFSRSSTALSRSSGRFVPPSTAAQSRQGHASGSVGNNMSWASTAVLHQGAPATGHAPREFQTSKGVFAIDALQGSESSGLQGSESVADAIDALSDSLRACLDELTGVLFGYPDHTLQDTINALDRSLNEYLEGAPLPADGNQAENLEAGSESETLKILKMLKMLKSSFLLLMIEKEKLEEAPLSADEIKQGSRTDILAFAGDGNGGPGDPPGQSGEGEPEEPSENETQPCNPNELGQCFVNYFSTIPAKLQGDGIYRLSEYFKTFGIDLTDFLGQYNALKNTLELMQTTRYSLPAIPIVNALDKIDAKTELLNALLACLAGSLPEYHRSLLYFQRQKGQFSNRIKYVDASITIEPEGHDGDMKFRLRADSVTDQKSGIDQMRFHSGADSSDSVQDPYLNGGSSSSGWAGTVAALEGLLVCVACAFVGAST